MQLLIGLCVAAVFLEIYFLVARHASTPRSTPRSRGNEGLELLKIILGVTVVLRVRGRGRRGGERNATLVSEGDQLRERARVRGKGKR